MFSNTRLFKDCLLDFLQSFWSTNEKMEQAIMFVSGLKKLALVLFKEDKNSIYARSVAKNSHFVDSVFVFVL